MEIPRSYEDFRPYYVRVESAAAPGMKYGIVDRCDDQAKALFAEGKCVVADVLVPSSVVVDIADLTEIPLGVEANEVDRWVESEFYKAAEHSDSLGPGVQAGKLFSRPVGDGHAWYLVTVADSDTCRVEWRGFCPDRWVDDLLGTGMTLSVARVEPFMRRRLLHSFGDQYEQETKSDDVKRA